MNNLFNLTIYEAHSLLKKKEISSVELTKNVLERINQVENKVKSFVTITEDAALGMANSADKRIKNGDINYLTGIPIAVKDNICTNGIKTTCSSKILENYVPPYDAYIVERLKESGYVLIGKTNLDEFAMGASSEYSAFFPSHNPWDLSRVPGGSSGGSASAIPAGEALGTIGEDTGGSIRLPASFCGIVGLKPTYGRVSRFGSIAMASSLDQIGPMGKSVIDCAIILQTIAGYDEKDSTSLNVPVPDYITPLEKGENAKFRIGIPKEFFVEGMDIEVRSAFVEAIKIFSKLGFPVEETTLKSVEYAVPTYYIIVPSEVSANLARYDGIRYGVPVERNGMWEEYKSTRGKNLGQEVKRRIMIGAYTLSAGYYDAYYLRAQRVRSILKKDFYEAFSKFDVLLSPTSPFLPFKIGERISDPIQMYLADICTSALNLAGLPGISVPCGFSKSGLPIGLQIIGPALSEDKLLLLANIFEKNTQFSLTQNLNKIAPELSSLTKIF